jgi:malate synthase
MPEGIEIRGPIEERFGEILTDEALLFIAGLQREFDERRRDLLSARTERQQRLDAGEMPSFLPETEHIRTGDWTVAAPRPDLADRRCEITGPVDRKMIINALNAPVKCFMADFEDSCSPTWDNVLLGQVNLRDAIDGTISFTNPGNGKRYALNEDTATLIVRPRGWHLTEKHCRIGGQRASASIFDFALYLANNHEKLQQNGTGPYFYLPKMESHLEARLWNDIFVAAQDHLGIPVGTIKATVLIETIMAAFEMDEILYELRAHSAGLNCGRWDYIFSFIKRFRNRADFALPDRAVVTMDRHFLSSYVKLLIKTCHRRGAHAMGGMAAQIPIKNDPEANAEAMAKVAADKKREAEAGHDGTWIAHPGLAETAMVAFDAVMTGPNQLDVLREDVNVTAADLLKVPTGDITEDGLRHSIRVGIQYVEAWLGGNGCVPLYNLMEDAATAEICRAQLWQCFHHDLRTADGQVVSECFDRFVAEELGKISAELGAERFAAGQFDAAARLFSDMVHKEECDEFLTLPAYEQLA